jgi:hypothetical protein
VRFTEINLFGVYVAPISVMMVAAWVVTIGLRRFATGRRAGRALSTAQGAGSVRIVVAPRCSKPSASI